MDEKEIQCPKELNLQKEEIFKVYSSQAPIGELKKSIPKVDFLRTEDLKISLPLSHHVFIFLNDIKKILIREV